MTALASLAGWLLLIPATPAISAPPGVVSVEVDFAPLPIGQTDFALYYKFYTQTNSGFEGVWHVRKQTVSDIRDYYKKRLEEDGWEVKAEGNTKLLLRGPKDDHPRTVEFKVDTFEFKPKGNVTPTVRRVGKL